MIKRFLAVAVLVAQLGMVVYARFVPWRVFTWAPNDWMVDYITEVSIDGRKLTPDEIESRYRLPAQYVYTNAIQDYLNYVRAYEESYGKNDHARVLVIYRINGGVEKQWTWPQR